MPPRRRGGEQAVGQGLCGAARSGTTPPMSELIVPCLWLDGGAEAAADLYVRALGGRVRAVSRYPRDRDNPGGRPRGSVLTVEVEVAGQRLTLLDGGPAFSINPSISLFVEPDTVEEAEHIWSVLIADGAALMPLGEYPWSPRFGWVRDRFGATWQIAARRAAAGPTTVSPCLMFTGEQHGRAEAALVRYAEVLGGRVTAVRRYDGTGGPAGTLEQGRATFGAQQLIAIDSAYAHGFTFGEGLSLMALCADQAEVDARWAALIDGGQPSRCGWLRDRFGVSWQVVPAAMSAWLSSADTAAAERVFAATLPMTKLDVGTLGAAFEGR